VTCQEFIEFLLDYDEGRLPPDVRARFDEHLTVCPDCMHYLASYRATIALGQKVFAEPQAELPDSVPDELVQAILDLRAKA
jgi:anti-sigma factor RsiW